MTIRHFKKITKTDKFKLEVIKGAITAYATTVLKGQTVTNPADVAKYLNLYCKETKKEKPVALFLDSKNKVRGVQEIFIDNVNSTILSPAEILHEVLKYPTSRLILSYNYPSGDPAPSQAVIQSTKRLSEVCRLMGVELLDHLVVGDDQSCSIRSDYPELF
ncbi:JAB domain-containing protein [Facklamia sp. P12955]|uniref:JAB domain-containing protein n=1 Tax=Facklamia sp. P12955 TaxID=3421946 RepID=UPI003D1632C9